MLRTPSPVQQHVSNKISLETDGGTRTGTVIPGSRNLHFVRCINNFMAGALSNYKKVSKTERKLANGDEHRSIRFSIDFVTFNIIEESREYKEALLYCVCIFIYSTEFNQ